MAWPSARVPVLLRRHLPALEAPLLPNILPFFILRLLPSCVGGCCFVREAVGVLNALVIISKEMRIMVVWQQ